MYGGNKSHYDSWASKESIKPQFLLRNHGGFRSEETAFRSSQQIH